MKNKLYYLFTSLFIISSLANAQEPHLNATGGINSTNATARVEFIPASDTANNSDNQSEAIVKVPNTKDNIEIQKLNAEKFLKQSNQINNQDNIINLPQVNEKNIPEALKIWIPWVKKDNENKNCPQENNCVFFPKLNVYQNGQQKNIVFEFLGVNYLQKAWVALPYDKEGQLWPINAQVNGKEAVIVEKNNIPYLLVEGGDNKVVVNYAQDKLLKQKTINLNFAPLSFSNNNLPIILDNQQLLIGQDNKISTSQSNLIIQTFRKLEDNIPLKLTTEIKIDYSGIGKEINLGSVIPKNFNLNKLNTDLKVFYKDNQYIVQLTPGQHFLEFEAYAPQNITEISTKGLINNIDKEIWSIQTTPEIRQINIQGAEQIDPKQVNIPSEWMNLPTWLVKNDLQIKTEKRGVSLNSPLDISVNRTSWYGFNHDKLTILDRLDMTNKDHQFISINNDKINIDFIKVNEIPQLIVLKENKPTILLPMGGLNISTQGTFTIKDKIPTYNFEGNNRMNNWEFNLAPRYRLLATTGTNSSGSWKDSWNLYSMFFLALTVFAFYRLTGKHIALLAALSIVVFQGTNVFSWIVWIPLLLIMAILKYLPIKHEFIHKYLKKLGLLLWLMTLIAIVWFVPQELRAIINPSSDSMKDQFFYVSLIPDILSVLAYLLAIYFIYKMCAVFKQRKLLALGFLIASLFTLSIPALFSTSKGTVFGTGNVGTTLSGSSLRVLDGDATPAMAPAPRAENAPFMAKSSPIAPQISIMNSQTMVQEERKISDEKVQVGSGTPNWEWRGHKFNIDIKKSAKEVKFYIASPLWVNVMGVIQIILLLTLSYNLGIYMIYVYGKKEWTKYIPSYLINNSLTKAFINEVNHE